MIRAAWNILPSSKRDAINDMDIGKPFFASFVGITADGIPDENMINIKNLSLLGVTFVYNTIAILVYLLDWHRLSSNRVEETLKYRCQSYTVQQLLKLKGLKSYRFRYQKRSHNHLKLVGELFVLFPNSDDDC